MLSFTIFTIIYIYIAQDIWEAATVWREFIALNAYVRKKKGGGPKMAEE